MFDFGLAKELPSAKEANSDGAWKLTTNTGTPRYMAPEIATGKPYNESSDTYTFCIVLWEMLALQPPFELYTFKSFKQKVWQSPHKRPYIQESWPGPIRLLLRRGWNAIPTERPTMSQISDILGSQVDLCLQQEEDGYHNRRHRFNNKNDVLANRRSTFVWEPPERSNSTNGGKGNLLSFLASPFVKKSPFRPGATPASSGSPRKIKKIPDSLLDGTQETQLMAILSPEENSAYFKTNDFPIKAEGERNGCVTSPFGLPYAPPLFEDDVDGEEEEAAVPETLHGGSSIADMHDDDNEVFSVRKYYWSLSIGKLVVLFQDLMMMKLYFVHRRLIPPPTWRTKNRVTAMRKALHCHLLTTRTRTRTRIKQ